ncbi:tripartite tricarboxylate transporter permease [Citreimonas sp.]|uniref:tripartite tricarboxylate transporter permease n=1 Tax=Citreimonas sp. TaxID=3036715 RepID=UPI0035C78EDE
MTLIEGITSGFLQSISWAVFPYLLGGSIFGLIIGVIPGLSGHFAMAMAVTFLYTMEPGAGIAFLLGAHATVAQGGGLTAILFSTPGTGQNAATLLDGPPMRDKGEAGVAVGAAMASCFLGATFGAIVLALLIPVLREVVLFFGPPEVFVLAFLALTFVAVLGKEDMTRSLIAALLGLLLAMIGVDNVTNTERFTMGSERMADGLSLVPVILGLFAVAEMIDLWARGGSLAKDMPTALSAKDTQKQIFKGIGTAFTHWWLVMRCSAIGTTMGLIPGLGSAPAAFVAYGHAKQTSKDKASFGKGNVEGVIGPEAANDAVEGGALASTLAFGIPGSSSMAILLSGLFILGLETGPVMLNTNVDLVFIMIFTIIIGNLIGTIVGMFLVNPLSRATSIRASVMVPVLMAIIATGAFAGDRAIFDIGVAVIFGIVGYAMKVLNYSRAALLIGFVLGFAVEKNLYLALLLDGPLFILQPIPLALAIITIVFLGWNVFSIYRDRRRRIIPGEPVN